MKYTEIDKQLARQQFAELRFAVQEQEISPEEFFRAFYSGNLEDLWFRIVQSNGQHKRIKGFSQIKNLAPSIEKHYYLAAAQGTRAVDNKRISLLHYEEDSPLTERSLFEKLNDWKTLGWPEPTLIVPTGGKSLHFLWLLNQFHEMKRVYETQVQMFRQAKHHHYDFDVDGWHWHDEQQNSLAPKSLRAPGAMHNKTLEHSFAFWGSGKKYDIEDFETLYPVEKRIGAWQWNDRKDHSKGGFWLPYKTPEQRQAEKEEKQRQDEQRRKEAAERRKKHAAYYGEDYDRISFNGTISLLQLISKRNLDTFNSSGHQGANNDPSVALANDLVGCEIAANELGVTISDRAGELLLDYYQRIGYDNREAASKSDAAFRKHRTPARTAEGLERHVRKLLGHSHRKDTLDKLNKKVVKKPKPVKQQVDTTTQPDTFKKQVKIGEESFTVDDASVGITAKGFGGCEVWNGTNYTVAKLFDGFSPSNAKKISSNDPKHNPAKTWARSWASQELEKDADHNSGAVVVGDINAVRRTLLLGQRISVADSANTKFESFLYIPTENLDNPSDNLYKSLSCLLNTARDAKKKGFKVDLVIEQKPENVKLIKFLIKQGLGFFLKVEDEQRNQRGAGFFVQQLKQAIKPDITINERYLPSTNEILNTWKKKNGKPTVIFIKSDTGTGKTTLVKRYLEEQVAKGSHYDPKLLAIYSLEKLTQVVAAKLGLNLYKNSDSCGKYAQSSNYKALNEPIYKGLAITINSLKKQGYAEFAPGLWADHKGRVVLLLDEIESTLNALSSSAIIPNKAEIEKALREIITVVATHKHGRIIAADANLSQSTIDFVKSCLPEGTKSCVVENTYKVTGRRKVIVFNSKEQLLYDLWKSKNNHNLIASDTRRILGKGAICSTKAIEHMLGGEDTCIRTDAETAHTIGNKNYEAISHLEQLDKQNKITKSLLISPAAATGISIEHTQFDAVYGIFKGVASGETIHQMLERDRSDAERKIFIAPCRAGTPYHHYSLDQLEAEEAHRNNLNMQGLADATELVASVGEMEGIVKNGKKKAQKAISEIKDISPELKQWKREKQVYHAWYGQQLRLNAIATMRDRGYEVVDADAPEEEEEVKQIKQLVDSQKEFCETTWEQHKQDVSGKYQEVKDLLATGQEDRFFKLEQQQDMTKEEQLLLECYKIQKWMKFPDFEMSPEHVELYTHHKREVDNGFFVYAALKGHGELGNSFAVKQDVEKNLFNGRTRSDIRSKKARHELLIEKLEVHKLISQLQEKGEYSRRDKFTWDFNEKLKEHAEEIYSLLGIRLDHREDHVIYNMHKILNRCGYKHESTKREQCDKVRVYYYQLEEIEPAVLQIWQHWLKFEEQYSQISEELKAKLQELDNIVHSEQPTADQLLKTRVLT